METRAHGFRARGEGPNIVCLLGPLADRRGCLSNRNVVLLQKQSTHPVMDYTPAACGLLPAVMS
jgi:hypothetical protein